MQLGSSLLASMTQVVGQAGVRLSLATDNGI